MYTYCTQHTDTQVYIQQVSLVRDTQVYIQQVSLVTDTQVYIQQVSLVTESQGMSLQLHCTWCGTQYYHHIME